MQTGTQRKLIAALLAFSCILSMFILAKSEPVKPKKLTHSAQLDSLITASMHELNIPSTQVRYRTIEVDSLFYRRVYTVRVAPNFSKTTLHYTLQREMWPYGVNTIGKLSLPDREMNIHLLHRGQVYRSLIVREDPELRLRQYQPEILPGQDSHEVD